MLSHGLKMNDGKTEFIIFGTSKQLDKVGCSDISVGGAAIRRVNNVRNLGFIFDSVLNFDKHISSKIRTAFHNIHNISRQLPWNSSFMD